MALTVNVSREEAKRIHSEYRKQIVLDEASGNMHYKDVPIFWSRAELLYNMYKEISALVGGSVGPIMARVTRPHGGSFVTFLRSEFGSDVSRDVLFSIVCNDAFATGWGYVNISEDEEGIDITAPKGFLIGQMFQKKGERSPLAVDNYFMGYFEGVISTLDRVPYRGEEVECVAKGDERCRLSFKKL